MMKRYIPLLAAAPFMVMASACSHDPRIKLPPQWEKHCKEHPEDVACPRPEEIQP